MVQAKHEPALASPNITVEKVHVLLQALTVIRGFDPDRVKLSRWPAAAQTPTRNYPNVPNNIHVTHG